jgi:hypothetical protein
MTLTTRKPTGKPSDFGDPRLPPRFWSKVKTSDSGCWEWQASLTAGGYGQYYPRKGDPQRAHRITYTVLVADIPDGLVIDHLCRNPLCCNPVHLEPVTSRENTIRGIGFAARYAAATHCPHGHPYAGANLRIRRCGRRACRECERIRVREQHARRREAS